MCHNINIDAMQALISGPVLNNMITWANTHEGTEQSQYWVDNVLQPHVYDDFSYNAFWLEGPTTNSLPSNHLEELSNNNKESQK